MSTQPGRLRRIRRSFMPSLALSGYVVKLYVSRFLLVLFVLVVILQALDLLNRSEEILAAEGASRAQLWQYIGWRLPELISQFTPFAGLLASLFTLAGLNQSSEITVMRGAGLSASQVITPIMLASLLVVAGHIVFHDAVTVDGSRRLDFWAENDYRPDTPPPPEGRQNIWLNDGNRVIEIRTATRFSDRVVLDDVTIYERAEDGDLSANIDADFALGQNGIWTLYGVRRFELETLAVMAAENAPFDFNFPLERIFAEVEQPEHAQLADLSAAISTLRRAGMETFSLETSYWHRFALAVSAFVMPLLGCFVAYGVPRAGARVGRILAGMALGFSYFVFDNYMIAMGGLGILPAMLAALAAPSIYMLAGLSLLTRLE